jgi:uncharacterized protein (TIGR03086 family)
MTDTDPTDPVTRLIEVGLDREAARQGATADVHHPTPAGDPEGEGMDTLTQFGHLGPLLAGVVGRITPDQLDRPTPCTEFTVRGVLEHMIGGATAFAAAYRGETAADPDLSDVLAGFGPALENLGGAVSAPGALDRTIAAPFGDVDGEFFARFIVLDGLVHGWDLATATGQSYDPPDELVATVDAFARRAIDPMRDGKTFAPAVDPAPDATPIERLAAYTGRRPLASLQER